MTAALQQIPAAAIRDTIAAVFQDGAYDRGFRETLWSRLVAWLGALLARFRDATSDSPVLFWMSIAIFALIIGGIVARLAYLVLARRVAASGAGTRQRAISRSGGDPWEDAQAAAAEGRYTDAAHLLYRALLEWLARTERIRLHPAKTAGDYVRELRASSSSALGRFRRFVLSYELMVYGTGNFDSARYDELSALARDVTATDG